MQRPFGGLDTFLNGSGREVQHRLQLCHVCMLALQAQVEQHLGVGTQLGLRQVKPAAVHTVPALAGTIIEGDVRRGQCIQARRGRYATSSCP